MPRIFFDIRYAIRKLLRAPRHTLAILLTIATGIGSNVVVDGFVRGISRSNSPFPSVPGVVSFFKKGVPQEAGPLSYEEYSSLKGRGDVFGWIGAARLLPATMATSDQSSIVRVAVVTDDLARALGLSLENGIVVSHDIWETEFAARSDLVGGELRLDGVKLHVNGIALKSIRGLYEDRPVDVWKLWRSDSMMEADPAFEMCGPSGSGGQVFPSLALKLPRVLSQT